MIARCYLILNTKPLIVQTFKGCGWHKLMWLWKVLSIIKSSFAILRFATSTQHQPITANWWRCRKFIQPPQLYRKFDQSVALSWTDVDKLPSALLPCLLLQAIQAFMQHVRVQRFTLANENNCERSRKGVGLAQEVEQVSWRCESACARSERQRERQAPQKVWI